MKQLERKEMVKQLSEPLAAALPQLEKTLRVIASGTAVATRKGRDLVPEADYALAVERVPLEGLSYEIVEVSREDALKFLSKESLVLPEAPRGYLLLTYQGLGLGFVKNLGNRTNSLLPSSRRIRMQA
jgi:NOL1/NOP2/fmu family ribosome biogenesis protein